MSAQPFELFTPGTELYPSHYTELHDGSGIAHDVIRERGYRTAMARAQLADLGFSTEQQRFPGIIMPVHRVAGGITHIFKPDQPRLGSNGKPIKYETPAGSTAWLDCPPRCREKLRDPEEPLIITEGAKKADAAASRGLTVVALAGVFSWRGRNSSGGTEPLPDWEYIPLKGRDVYIAFDSDVITNKQVRSARKRLAALLKGRGASMYYINLPAPEDPKAKKAGLDDYLLTHTVTELWALAVEPDDLTEGRPSQADEMASIATAEAVLWHTADMEAWADVLITGHRESWPVRSGPFKQWLAHRLYQKRGTAPNAQALADALLAIEGKGQFEGGTCEVHTRVAPDPAGGIWLDLANDRWEAVRVTPDGWEIVAAPPVRFRRTLGMRSLPTPQRGGSLDVLRDLFGVPAESWPLIASWLVGALHPRGPYPVLALYGEQGSGKTSLARALRELVDPNAAPVRSEPRDERDLAIAARNGWIVSLDNLSRLPATLSDALCRLSTGGGFATRTLHTNDVETIFSSTRPIILNGITELASRGDLLDRALVVNLPAIPEERRRRDGELQAALAAALPGLLGALLDAASMALRREPEVHLDRLPRMADFATWAVAAEPALGLEPGEFMAAYTRNRAEANESALEALPISAPLIELVNERGTWEGTATALLKEIEGRVGEATLRLREWPKNARAFSGQLRRIAPNLRARGITVDLDQREPGTGKKFISLENARNFASQHNFASQDPQKPSNSAGFGCDAKSEDVTQIASQGNFASQKKPEELPMVSGACDANTRCDAKLQPFSNGACADPSGACIVPDFCAEDGECLMARATRDEGGAG